MLYLHVSLHDASPKAISRRTSYLRARLEFLRYPQVITIFFNRCVFAPPQSFTSASHCSWIGRPVSGLLSATSRPLQTRFLCGSDAEHLNLAALSNSLARSSISTALRSLIALCLLVCIRFQILFHSPPGVLFTFPSRYFSSIGHQVVFSLGEWSPLLPTGFLVSCGTLVPARPRSAFAYGTLTLFGPDLHRCSAGFVCRSSPARNPIKTYLHGLGSSPFARRYSENRSYFLFLRLLRCFSSPGSLPPAYLVQQAMPDSSSGGFPHSDICGSRLMCSSPQLFAAYHVLLRLLMPRHPPYALISLIFYIKFSILKMLSRSLP